MANKSRIEYLIDEIEDYLDGCKLQLMSNTKIIVDKEQIKTYIDDLKKTTPEELAKYQKIVSNREAILKDAKEKADALINEAAAQTSEMVNQNSIMKQAYAQADEVVKSAYIQAQQILTTATLEANEIRSSAIEYIDGQLAQYENVVAQTVDLTQKHYEHFYGTLIDYYNVIHNNRMQLNPPAPETVEVPLDYQQTDGGSTGPVSVTDNATIDNAGQGQSTGSNTAPIGSVSGSSQNTGDLKLM